MDVIERIRETRVDETIRNCAEKKNRTTVIECHQEMTARKMIMLRGTNAKCAFDTTKYVNRTNKCRLFQKNRLSQGEFLGNPVYAVMVKLTSYAFFMP